MRSKAKAPHPTPKRRRYVHRLDRIRGVRLELGRLYREARLGTLQPSDATKLAFVLSTMGRVIEGSALEERIAKLEKRLEAEERRRLEEQL